MAVGKIEQLSSSKPTTRELIEELRREQDPIGFEMAMLRAERDRYREALERLLAAADEALPSQNWNDMEVREEYSAAKDHARQALKGEAD